MVMNPYEAPQSSLEPEKRPRVPVKYEQFDTRELGRIVLRALLLFGFIVSGLLLAHRAAVALGCANDANVEDLDAKLPYIFLAFCAFSWLLWRMRKPQS